MESRGRRERKPDSSSPPSCSKGDCKQEEEWVLKLAREDTSLGNNEDSIGPWPGTDCGGNRTLLFPRPEPIEGMDLGTRASVDSGELLLSEFCNPPGLMFSLGPHCTALAKAPAVGQNVLEGLLVPFILCCCLSFPLQLFSKFFCQTHVNGSCLPSWRCLLILQFTKKKDRKFLSLPKSPKMPQSIEARSV